jgi:hypothetical protein
MHLPLRLYKAVNLSACLTQSFIDDASDQVDLLTGDQA